MKYLIIGAVAGGASTAARLRRMDEKAEIILFEKGGYVSYANCGLPYYIGEVINDRDLLFVQTVTSFNQRFNIEVRIYSEVKSIDTAQKSITVTDLKKGVTYSESYDKLVLSPGAEPIRPPLPGIDLDGIFTLRSVPDMDRIKEFAKNKRMGHAVVIGGGFIGLEMAENLHHLGMKVSIIEMGNQVLAPLDFPIAAIVQQHIRSKGLDLRLSSTVTGFEKIKEGIRVFLKDAEHIDADVVILSIGVRPDTRLAQSAGLELGASKGIKVNEYLQTSDPDIYAVGDAIEFPNPLTGKSMSTYLAGPANKQGRICANNMVMGNVQKYPGSINTAIVKVFDMTVGTAGMASKHLQAAGIEHLVSTTHSGSHAGYYPGSRQMGIQLCFTPGDGQLLGAQVVGFKGVDKRLDLLASAIKRESNIHELTEFEHAYAPPFSSAKDPVNIAGFVAENILDGQLALFYWNEVDTVKEKGILIDVRSREEFNKAHIPGAVSFPVDELRSHLKEISKYPEISIYCLVGLRGYLAYRILKQNGFEKVKNLSGGFTTWQACHNETMIGAKEKRTALALA
jgi:NADPH-dependent 2,4-dienoyl-CoA reductase/sulfur reductase-like enzyme/rhodanese-related sulfurtransferase